MAPKIKGVETRVDGANVAFLLVHGFCSAPDELQTFAKLLEDRGIDSFSVQLAGHGTKPDDLNGTNWKDWYNSAVAGLEYVKSWNTEYLLIAGISMGGAIALLLASEHEGIDGLILFAPGMKIDGLVPKLVPLLKYVIKDREVDVVAVQEIYDVKRTKYAREPVWIYHELFKLQKQARKILSNVSIPTIVIQGTADKTINPKYGKLAYEGISSPDKQLFMIEGGEHVIPCHHTRAVAYPHAEKFISRITKAD